MQSGCHLANDLNRLARRPRGDPSTHSHLAQEDQVLGLARERARSAFTRPYFSAWSGPRRSRGPRRGPSASLLHLAQTENLRAALHVLAHLPALCAPRASPRGTPSRSPLIRIDHPSALPTCFPVFSASYVFTKPGVSPAT